jgi:hypothetical protein
MQELISLSPAPDVAAAYPTLKSVRFVLTSDCPLTECDLVVATGEAHISIPFPALVDGAVAQTPAIILYVDHTSADEQHNSISNYRQNKQLKIARFIAKAYTHLFPIASIFSFIGLLLASTRFRQSTAAPLLAMTWGALIAIATRIALIAYIAATSWPDIFLLYASPASPFVILFVVSGLYLGYLALVEHKMRAQPLQTNAFHLKET